jgi:DNA end-binding protein Ku
MPRSTSPRRYISDFNLQVGPISITGSLTPLVSTESREATRFPFICPTCEPVTPVSQSYVCPEGHTNSVGDLARSRELPDGTLVRLSEEEYAAVRVPDLPANVLRVSVHPAEQVSLVDHGTSYCFQPPVIDPTFAALIKLIQDSDKAFLGVANLRGHEGLFQLSVFEGNLILAKKTWPESINEFITPDVAPDMAIVGAAGGMLDRISSDFDPENFRSQHVARAKELTARLAGDQTVQHAESNTTESPASREDLLAILNSFAV